MHALIKGIGIEIGKIPCVATSIGGIFDPDTVTIASSEDSVVEVSAMVYVKTLLFALLVPGTVAGLVPYWIASSVERNIPAWYEPWSPVGWIPILLGLIVLTWCAMDFARKGQGTPAPIDPPKHLVINGLYRHVRNPMYVGVLSILLGEWLLAPSIPLMLYAIVIGCMFHAFIMFYEEPVLRKKFGTAYEDYCREVNRWVPRSRPLNKST